MYKMVIVNTLQEVLTPRARCRIIRDREVLSRTLNRLMTTVKCMVCKRKFDGKAAYEHTLKTGHNRWELLLPKKLRRGGKDETMDKGMD